MARYLVTGSTGFLGRTVARGLIARGDEVVGLARGEHGGSREPGVRFVRGDVLAPDSLAQALGSAMGAFDGVFHCAGPVSRDPADAAVLHRAHVEGTRNVALAARAAHVRRLVVASSSGTVALSERGDHAATEADPTPIALIARFPYYRAKLYAEREALSHNGQDGLEVVCVLPSLLLGPGDTFGSSTGDVQKFLERAVPAVPAGGMAYVDVRDAADAMRAAMDRGVPGRRYLVSGSNVTVREFFARLERVSGVAAPRLPMPRSAALARAATGLFSRAVRAVGGEPAVDPVSAEMAQLFWYVDSTLASRELGFSPRDAVETLADTVRDLRSAGANEPLNPRAAQGKVTPPCPSP